MFAEACARKHHIKAGLREHVTRVTWRRDASHGCRVMQKVVCRVLDHNARTIARGVAERHRRKKTE
jgi:hypothetical protein